MTRTDNIWGNKAADSGIVSSFDKRAVSTDGSSSECCILVFCKKQVMRFLWLYYIKGESEVKSYLVPVHVHSLVHVDHDCCHHGWGQCWVSSSRINLTMWQCYTMLLTMCCCGHDTTTDNVLVCAPLVTREQWSAHNTTLLTLQAQGGLGFTPHY